MIFVRSIASVAFVASLASAPFQCASKEDPNRKMEEEPADALYQLAQKFKAEGDVKSAQETLKFIVERYPSSRFAETARRELQEPAPTK
jgi:outer membrane protein assembly factor BamD (BamD/ComL family)